MACVAIAGQAAASRPARSLDFAELLAASDGTGRLAQAQQPETQPEQQSAEAAGVDSEAPESEKPAAATDTETEPEESDSEALETFSQARDTLMGYRSVQATIREKVAIGDREFKATGSYVQGTDLKLRLEYEVTLGRGAGAVRGSLLQVCDGQLLWTRYLLEDGGSKESGESQAEPHITRRDVRRILDAAAKSGNIPENILLAELGLGGLPSLLASLESSLVFNEQEETADGKYLVVSGTWKQQLRERLPANSDDNERLPPHIPDAVRVYFDRENLFPRRILYLKRPVGRDYLRPMVSVDFVEVTLNAPVSGELFQYVPPDKVFPIDITSQYLQRLIAPQSSQTNAPAQQPALPQKSGPASVEPSIPENPGPAKQ